MDDKDAAQNPGGEAHGIRNPQPSEIEFAHALKAEQDRLIASGHLSNAPTLVRLLQFLVEQTLAGRGDQLKSYSVAVDGLGRDPSFDAQADSYPRVQILRLRKLLEAYYARHGTADRLCIYLKTGSYRVRLSTFAHAYPELALAHEHFGHAPSASAQGMVPALPIAGGEEQGAPIPKDNASTLPEKAAGGNADAVNAPVRVDPTVENPDPAYSSYSAPPQSADDVGDRQRRRFWLLFALLFAVVLFALGVKLYWLSEPIVEPTTTVAEPQAPLLLLEPVRSASDPASTALADDIYAQLADGIGRFWLVRLRLTDDSNDAKMTNQPAYRLSIQLSETKAETRTAYLRLTDARTSDLFWSNRVAIKPQETLADNLGPTIAQLAGPFGVIAARETHKIERRYTVGYSCMLGYLDYLVSRDTQIFKALSGCLAIKLPDARLDAVRLALYSFYVMEPANMAASEKPKAAKAFDLARQAVKVDPKEAYAHFAMARIFFITGKCGPGRRHSVHALDANPFDPVLLAILGNFASNCGYAEGAAILDKAYAYRSPGESHARLSLILAAIQQHRLDRLEMLRDDGEEPGGTSAAYHHLCETLIAAALGEQNDAKASWRNFKQAPHANRDSDDAMLQSVILSPDIRKRVLAFLERSGVR